MITSPAILIFNSTRWHPAAVSQAFSVTGHVIINVEKDQDEHHGVHNLGQGDHSHAFPHQMQRFSAHDAPHHHLQPQDDRGDYPGEQSEPVNHLPVRGQPDDVYLWSTLKKCQVIQSDLTTLCSAEIPTTGSQMPTPTLSPARNRELSAAVPFTQLSSPPHAPSQRTSTTRSLPPSSQGSSLTLEASKEMRSCPVSTSSAQSLPAKFTSPTTCTGDYVAISAEEYQAPLVGKVGNSRTAANRATRQKQIYSETEALHGFSFIVKSGSEFSRKTTTNRHDNLHQHDQPLQQQGVRLGNDRLHHYPPPLQHGSTVQCPLESHQQDLHELRTEELGALFPIEMDPLLSLTYARRRSLIMLFHEMSVHQSRPNPSMPMLTRVACPALVLPSTHHLDRKPEQSTILVLLLNNMLSTSEITPVHMLTSLSHQDHHSQTHHQGCLFHLRFTMVDAPHILSMQLQHHCPTLPMVPDQHLALGNIQVGQLGHWDVLHQHHHLVPNYVHLLWHPMPGHHQHAVAHHRLHQLHVQFIQWESVRQVGKHLKQTHKLIFLRMCSVTASPVSLSLHRAEGSDHDYTNHGHDGHIQLDTTRGHYPAAHPQMSQPHSPTVRTTAPIVSLVDSSGNFHITTPAAHHDFSKGQVIEINLKAGHTFSGELTLSCVAVHHEEHHSQPGHGCVPIQQDHLLQPSQSSVSLDCGVCHHSPLTQHVLQNQDKSPRLDQEDVQQCDLQYLHPDRGKSSLPHRHQQPGQHSLHDLLQGQHQHHHDHTHPVHRNGTVWAPNLHRTNKHRLRVTICAMENMFITCLGLTFIISPAITMLYSFSWLPRCCTTVICTAHHQDSKHERSIMCLLLSNPQLPAWSTVLSLHVQLALDGHVHLLLQPHQHGQVWGPPHDLHGQLVAGPCLLRHGVVENTAPLISSPTAHLLTKPTVQPGDEQEHHGPGPPLHHHVQLAITVGSQQHAHPLQIQPPLAAQGDKKEHHAAISTSSPCHCNIFSFSISWNKLDSLFKLICPIIFTRWSCLPVRQVSKTHLKTQSRINSPEDVGGDSEPFVDALALASGVQELREGVQDLHEHHALHPCHTIELWSAWSHYLSGTHETSRLHIKSQFG